MITHGHHYHVSTGPEILKQEALSIGADVVMFGHTHRPYFEQDEDITVLNPGKCVLSETGRQTRKLYDYGNGRRREFEIRAEIFVGKLWFFVQNHGEKRGKAW